MKKKILLVLLILIVTFTITGCKNNSKEQATNENNNEVTIDGIKYSFSDSETFHDMKIKYDKNAKNFKKTSLSNNEYVTLVYLQDGTKDDLLRAVLSYHKDTKVSKKLKDYDLDENTPTKTYNNIKWYDWYSTEKYKSTILDVYFYQNGNDTYMIAFTTPKNQNFNLNDYVNAFMSNVSFK